MSETPPDPTRPDTHCSKCGTRNPHGVTECLYCGEPLMSHQAQPGSSGRATKRRSTATRVAVWLLLAFPWLLTGAMVWYASDRAGWRPAPGSILITHYPELIRQGKKVLLACWLGAFVLLLYSAARRRTTHVSKMDEWALVLAISGPVVAWLLTFLLPWNAVLPILAAFWISALLLVGHERRLMLYAGMTVLALIVPLVYVDAPLLSRGWHVRGSLRTPDGSVYHLQRWQVLQGRTEALTEEVDRGTLFLRTRVLGTGSGESMAMLVRPAATYDLSTGASSGYVRGPGRLVQNRDGRWIAFIFVAAPADESNPGCATSLAYDRGTGTIYTSTENAESAKGLRELPPFILVGPSDKLNNDDLEALLYARRRLPGWSANTSLEADLRNPNPLVREAAARILGGTPQQTSE